MSQGKTREVGIRLSVKDKEVVERALKGIGADGEAALKRIEKAAAPASTSLVALNRAAVGVRSSVAGLVGGMAAGLIPTLSLAAALNGARKAMEEFGDIADQAKSAALDVEYFQGLAYQAKLAGIEIGELSSALDGFAKNSELAEKGKGKLYSQLKDMNPELLRAIQLADTQEQRIGLVADAIDRVADKAGLASAIFGDIGPRIAGAFEGGAAAIDKTIERAREMGVIIDRDTIGKAEEMGDKFDTLSLILDTKFKTVLVELAPLLVSTLQAMVDISNAINETLDRFRDVQSLSKAGLYTRLRDLGAERLELESQIIWQQGKLDRGETGLWGVNAPAIAGGIERARKRMEEITAEEAIVLARMKEFDAPATPPVKTGGGGGGGLPVDRDAERLAEQKEKRIADVIAKLKEQTAALGMTNREQAIQNALSQAQVSIADEQGREIAELAGIYYDQKAAIESTNEAMSYFARTGVDAIEAMIDGSKSLSDVMGDVGKAIQKAVLQATLLGEGPLAGLFGTKSDMQGQVGGVLGSLIGSILKPGGGGGGYYPGLTGPSLLNANGNIFTGPSDLSAFTNSIVRSRTPFTYAAKGLAGVMGEAGNSPGEAILPLLRDARGRLGVSSAGGGVPVVVNVEIVNATGDPIAKESVSSRRNSKGGIDVVATIRSVVADGIATPGDPINRSLRTSFGLSQQLTRR